ncbi:hypothetical protein MRX96_057723, partial [Rhipicephalus microplus]
MLNRDATLNASEILNTAEAKGPPPKAAAFGGFNFKPKPNLLPDLKVAGLLLAIGHCVSRCVMRLR